MVASTFSSAMLLDNRIDLLGKEYDRLLIPNGLEEASRDWLLAYTQKEVAKRHDSAKANNAVTLRRLCVKADFAVRRDMLWIERLTFLVEGLPQNCYETRETDYSFHFRFEWIIHLEIKIGRQQWKSLFRAFRYASRAQKLEEFCIPRDPTTNPETTPTSGRKNCQWTMDYYILYFYEWQHYMSNWPSIQMDSLALVETGWVGEERKSHRVHSSWPCLLCSPKVNMSMKNRPKWIVTHL